MVLNPILHMLFFTYDDRNDLKTFHVIIAYDANKTFTILNFGYIDWYSKDKVSGIDAGDCKNFEYIDDYCWCARKMDFSN